MKNGEELVENQFYNYGNSIIKFLGKSGNKKESYPQKWSNGYYIQYISIDSYYPKNVISEKKELFLNPEYRCFKEAKLAPLIKEYVANQEKKIKMLKSLI